MERKIGAPSSLGAPYKIEKPQIYWRLKGGLFIADHLYTNWVVKVPQKRNRLSRGGGAGLKLPDMYDLKHNKKGILYIDHSERAYVMIPKEILGEPEMKDCNGIKKSIFAFDVNKLINDHNLELIPIPVEGETLHPYETGLSGEIRKKFGL